MATQNKSNMEAVFASLTDSQRVETLNSVYQKGISIPKDQLAFSADKLVYLKPFIAKLTNNQQTEDLTSRILARQIIDELLMDILNEVQAFSHNVENGAKEYGLESLLNKYEEDFYLSNQVA